METFFIKIVSLVLRHIKIADLNNKSFLKPTT